MKDLARMTLVTAKKHAFDLSIKIIDGNLLPTLTTLMTGVILEMTILSNQILRPTQAYQTQDGPASRSQHDSPSPISLPLLLLPKARAIHPAQLLRHECRRGCWESNARKLAKMSITANRTRDLKTRMGRKPFTAPLQKCEGVFSLTP